MAHDGLAYAKGGSNSPCIWDSDTLMLFLSGVCENLEKMGVMAVLSDSGFYMTLDYMAYYRGRDVEWQQCTSSWLPYNFSMGEVSHVPSRSACSTLHRDADGNRKGDPILPACPVLFVPGDLTPLQTN